VALAELHLGSPPHWYGLTGGRLLRLASHRQQLVLLHHPQLNSSCEVNGVGCNSCPTVSPACFSISCHTHLVSCLPCVAWGAVLPALQDLLFTGLSSADFRHALTMCSLAAFAGRRLQASPLRQPEQQLAAFLSSLSLLGQQQAQPWAADAETSGLLMGGSC